MRANRRIRRAARRLFRFCCEGGKPDPARVRDAARRITEERHREYISLLWEFHRLVKLEYQRHTAEIASAAPLENDLRARIAGRLEKAYGAALQVRYVEDPGLIGGVRVCVGNDVYDDSVRYRLSQLQRSFGGRERPSGTQ